MKKGLVFILGLITGMILTAITLFVISKEFKFRKFNLLISDCKIERYEPSLQTD